MEGKYKLRRIKEIEYKYTCASEFQIYLYMIDKFNQINIISNNNNIF